MHWDVGIQIGEEHGQITVQPHQVKEGAWKSEVDLALEMAQATPPNEKIEFLYVMECQE